MIPKPIRDYLATHYQHYEPHAHAPAMTAQELAHAEHVSGYRVAKPVVVRLDGELAIAVVAATDRVNLAALEEATAGRAELVPEREFAARFAPCEAGAEPPLAMFGARVFVDERFMRERKILMPAGTHEDAVALDTGEWLWCERVQPVLNLGRVGRG